MKTRKTLFYIILIATATILFMSYHDIRSQPEQFPEIFYMDNFYECSKYQGNAYCTANMNLIPKDLKSEFWQKIEDWSLPWNRYDRTVIHRTLCIPSQYDDYLAKKSFIETRTTEELKMYNLSAVMFSIDCKEEGSHFGADIRVIIIGFSIYMGIILLATLCAPRCKGKDATYKWLTAFSLKSNWKKLTKYRNSDFQKLKCIQGIRTYQSTIVICCHGVLSFGQLYIKNTSYVEEIFSNSVFWTLSVFVMFIIQTYFVISSWLLTNQILEMFKENERFSVKDGLLLFLHRVSRFWPVLFVMVFVGMPLFINFCHGPGTFELVNILSQSCRDNWWATIFQVTNLLDIYKVCNPGMWSLTLDTQFYAITIILLYITLNYKVDLKRCLIFMFIFAYMVNMMAFYQEELPLITAVNLKLVKRIDFFKKNILARGYFGFWINAGSSLLGILFGYFYFHYKGSTQIKTFEKLCNPIFAVIPIAVVLIGTLDANRIVTILIGPLLKPLFGFGIACGIYGMSRNIIQGLAKSICENKYAVLLGNFTFSTYICHFLVIFCKEANSTSPIEIGILTLIVSCIAAVIISFAAGIGCALTVEQSGINIKKMILPAIGRTEVFCNQSQNGYRNKHK